MFKLIDIIKRGGSNPKLNKFLNRYVISKKEKTNLIKEIKNSKGGSSSDGEYYKFITHNSLNDMKQMACLFKYKNMIANEHIIESSDIYTNYDNYKAFCFMPINICTSEGCRYIKSLITFLKEAYGIEDMSAIGIQPITKEEFYDLNNI